LIRLIGVIFSNGAMLSVSDKYDSVNNCTQEISKLIKLHIQWVWENAHKFIRQLAHSSKYNITTLSYQFNITHKLENSRKYLLVQRVHVVLDLTVSQDLSLSTNHVDDKGMQ